MHPFLRRLTIVTLALAIPTPLAAQGQLDTLRIDSLMSVAADRVQSAAIAAAREDADAVLDVRTDLFGHGGVFGDVLGELAAADCEQARHWVNVAADEFFWLSSFLTLAWERSADGEMDRWPRGPEAILNKLETIQEIWTGVKNENRESCHRPTDRVVRNSGINWGPRIMVDSRESRDLQRQAGFLVRDGGGDRSEYCPRTLSRIACNRRLRRL